MITLTAFLRGVQSIIDERPSYKLGGFGLRGVCDCIGLIIGGVRRAGGVWSGTHGSNWAARNAMQGLALGIKPEQGLIVYKARDASTSGYSLPSAYDGHPDRMDYYHVGVVTSVNPLRIAHCTSWSGGSGIKIDTAIGQWRYSGRLKAVQYDQPQSTPAESEVTPMTGYIDLPANETVFLRISPSKSSAWFARVPGQAAVDIISTNNGWVRARWGGHDGYIAEDFVVASADPPAPAPIASDAELWAEIDTLLTRALALVKARRGVS